MWVELMERVGSLSSSTIVIITVILVPPKNAAPVTCDSVNVNVSSSSVSVSLFIGIWINLEVASEVMVCVLADCAVKSAS